MDEELKLDIKEIKNNLLQISDSISRLAEILQISLENKRAISSSENKEIFKLLEEVKPTANQVNNLSNISKYRIDYSYINDRLYLDWKGNLEKYSNEMANFGSKDNIINFCFCAIKSIESAIEVLFEKAFQNLSQENINFLDAYDRVKSSYESRGWSLPQIYVDIDDCQDIDNCEIKKIPNNRYVAFREITRIRTRNIGSAVEISMNILNKNFMNDYGLRAKFFLINHINKLRQVEAHGSRKDVEIRIQEIQNDHIKKLYLSDSKYTDIKDTVSWFIRTIYEIISD